MFEKIEIELTNAVGIIRLNQPAMLNALSTHTVDEINAALDQLLPDARAILLTGNGRAFCSGADLGVAPVVDQEGLPDVGSVLETHANPLMKRLRHLPVPWLTSVRGAAAGVGCSLALSADIVVAEPKAYFLLPFVNIGLVPDGGASWVLARTVGRVRAMEVMMLGERLPAPKALEWGLINRIVEDDELEQVSLALARRLATAPSKSLAMIRELGWSALDSDYYHMLERERQMQRLAGQTEDHAEGVAAFMAKRPPVFHGK